MTACTAIFHRPPPRIIVADDDPDVLGVLGAALRKAGHRVAEARSGLELFALIAAVAARELVQPDAVVTDVKMPMFGGLDALRNARNLGLSMPFILMTAFRDPAAVLQAERLGATAFLEKPFDVEHLVREIGSAVSSAYAPF